MVDWGCVECGSTEHIPGLFYMCLETVQEQGNPLDPDIYQTRKGPKHKKINDTPKKIPRKALLASLSAEEKAARKQEQKEASRKANAMLDRLLDGAETPSDWDTINTLMGGLKKALIERALSEELSHHLGYEKGDEGEKPTPNRRNGASSKTLQTEDGELSITIPRDRLSDFEPQMLRKHQRRLDGFDEKIIALYARGLSMKDIQGHLMEIYGVDVSPDLISTVTDAVIDEVQTWQSRPLETHYAILYLDAIVVKIRENAQIINKAVYLAIGVDLEGNKEILGLWIAKGGTGAEGAKFWLSIMTELKNRGIEDVFIACCDGLKGLPEAITSVFSDTQVQLCIVHMIRNSLKYVSWKDYKSVTKDLKTIYAAPTEEAAKKALETFDDTWSHKYPTIARSWRDNWANLIPFLGYPPQIRKVIYTTNTIEAANRQIRKVIKTKGSFPSDDAALKLIYSQAHIN